VGLIPNSFSVTGQIFMTFTLSSSAFIGVLLLSCQIQGFNFIYFFIPKNVPVFLVPFLMCIEIISYVSRVFSLAIRLFANIVAGHVLLHILMNSYLSLCKVVVGYGVWSILLVIPCLILCGIVLLEFGIAFLQAYVFLVLVSIYLNDAFGSSH